jgi:hypothetical protein
MQDKRTICERGVTRAVTPAVEGVGGRRAPPGVPNPHSLPRVKVSGFLESTTPLALSQTLTRTESQKAGQDSVTGLGFAYGAQPSTTMCVYMTCICDFVTLTVGQCVTGRLRPGLCERVAVALLAHAGSWREM